MDNKSFKTIEAGICTSGDSVNVRAMSELRYTQHSTLKQFHAMPDTETAGPVLKSSPLATEPDCLNGHQTFP